MVINELNQIWNILEDKIFNIKSTDVLYNMYKNDICKQNLKNYFESFKVKPEILIIGEAPGPSGCRFSGIPFVSEVQLLDKDFPFHGKQSSLQEPFKSKSSEIFWSALKPFFNRFFTWNTIPFYPHDKNEDMRTPSEEEKSRFLFLLKHINNILKPKLIIAIGRHAESSLNVLSINNMYVRHPSFGGDQLFRNQIKDIFSGKTKIKQTEDLRRWMK